MQAVDERESCEGWVHRRPSGVEGNRRDLQFWVLGVEASCRGLVPLLRFRLGMSCPSPDDVVESAFLRVRIQLAAPHCRYSERETARLIELFGQPSQWARTLRNRLWISVSTAVGPFTGATETDLPVPCSYDLNVAATKYFHALDSEGSVPLSFRFRGTVIYPGRDGALRSCQVHRETEWVYWMPLRAWRRAMEEHYPDTGWIFLKRDVLDRLFAYRCEQGLSSWEETVNRLLPGGGWR